MFSEKGLSCSRINKTTYLAMKKRTLITLYALLLLSFGIPIVILGFTFGDIESFSALSGSQEFVSVVKIIGLVFIMSGVGGMGWALLLTKNPVLPGYARLNGAGLVTFILLFFILGGPFWLLIGWTMWLIPAFQARSSTLET